MTGAVSWGQCGQVCTEVVILLVYADSAEEPFCLSSVKRLTVSSAET